MNRAHPTASRTGRRTAGAVRRAALVLAALSARAFAADPPAPPAPAAPPGLSARALMEDGRRRYAAGDFAGAVARFEEAGRRAGGRLDPARARFNAAAALQRLGRLDEAEERLQQALRTGDLETQAKAWYNRGHAAMTRAEQQAAAGDPAGARAPMAEALEAYRNAIRLAPDDLEAKINFEWTQRRLKELDAAAQQQTQSPSERPAQQPENPPPAPSENGESEGEKPSPTAERPENGERPPPDPSDRSDSSDPSDPSDSSDSSEPRGETLGQNPPDGPEREMTPQDAARLLDALREEEDAQRRNLRLRLGAPTPVEKDW